jgi:hypothetical protein
MVFSSSQNASLAVVSVIFYLTVRSYVTSRRKPLPPGPRGLPLVGNVLDVPKTQEWLAFMEMARKYGVLRHHSSLRSSPCRCNVHADSDVISLNLAGDTVIVLNSLSAVDALLEDKSAIYSDR